jgi:perosamine synthetase
VGKEELKAIKRVLKSGRIAYNKETELFEKEFAKYVGAKYAIFTNCCTSALKMAYRYYKELGYTDFICPDNTYNATYAAAYEVGLKRKNKLTEKCIKVNVHYGSVKDKSECDIEDSAHRIEPNDKLIGKVRCYSFHPTKNMTTGQGGMLVTNDKKIYDKCRLYWLDGRASRDWDAEPVLLAGGYDNNDIQAAIGRVQLKRLPKFNKRREQIVKMYNEAFDQSWQGNHLYPYFIEDVGGLIEHLKKSGIQASYHYPGSGWKAVSLPLYPSLTNKQVRKIISEVYDYVLPIMR